MGELRIEPGAPILSEGAGSAQLFTALSGLGIRYKTLPNGNRQMVNLVFPDDFIGLQAGVMGEMCHSVQATSAMTLCVFDRSELWNFFKNHPARAFDITWLAAREEHFLSEALTSVGQRSALSSMAWALLRIFQRGEMLDLTDGASMDLPFKQQDIADALGLSLVHTNKTLAKLRERQLATWSDGVLHLHDIDALAEVAEMELTPPPQRPLI